MKVEITEKGVRRDGVLLEKGTEINVPGDTMPAGLVNKAREIGGKAGKTSVTNPKKGAVKDPAPSAAERQARMKELVAGLDADKDFITNGAPDVAALNALLNEGEEPFTAAERDQLWPGIAAG